MRGSSVTLISLSLCLLICWNVCLGTAFHSTKEGKERGHNGFHTQGHGTKEVHDGDSETDVVHVNGEREEAKVLPSIEKLSPVTLPPEVTSLTSAKLPKKKATREEGTPPPKSEKQILQTTSVPETSEATTSSKATTKPSTAATATPNTSTPKPSQTPTTSKPKDGSKDLDLYCLCDLHMNTCDMNCCCDLDCKEEDRHFFTHCLDQVGVQDDRSSPRRQRSCYKSFVTFTHYTQESGVQSDNGMLCIVRDNNKADNILPPSKLNEIRKRLTKGEIDLTPKYFMDTGREIKYKKEQYKYGSPILGVKAEDLDKEKEVEELLPYGFPSSYQGVSCSKVTEPLKFLQDFHSECVTHFTNVSEACLTLKILDVNTYLNEFHILKNPGNEEYELITISPRKETCKTSSSCEGAVFSSPLWNKDKKICQNALTELNLTFYFGLEGITEVVATAKLQDLKKSTEQKELKQTYRAVFKWNYNNTNTNATKGQEEEDWPRSGNPGYIVGKPVIIGEKVPAVKEIVVSAPKDSADTEDEEDNTESPPIQEVETSEVEMVLVWKDPSRRWMSIHGPGKCDKDNPARKNVLFDYSHMTTCLVNLTDFKYCEGLQLHIAKVLLGEDDPMQFDKRKWQVAAFGNSHPGLPSEWVPITTKGFPIGFLPTTGNSKHLVSRGCDSIVSSLQITLAYAFVGSVDFPQAKITGVLYEPGDPVSIGPDEGNKSFVLSTTVAFKDVTAPPITRVPSWPLLSISLPKDFFYPFSM